MRDRRESVRDPATGWWCSARETSSPSGRSRCSRPSAAPTSSSYGVPNMQAFSEVAFDYAAVSAELATGGEIGQPGHIGQRDMDGQRHGAQAGPGQHHHRIRRAHAAGFSHEFGLSRMGKPDLGEPASWTMMLVTRAPMSTTDS